MKMSTNVQQLPAFEPCFGDCLSVGFVYLICPTGVCVFAQAAPSDTMPHRAPREEVCRRGETLLGPSFGGTW